MRLPLILLTPLALLACSDQPDASVAPAAEQTEPVLTPTPATSASGSATTGGDGSQIRLTALTAADRAAHPLEGELGCSFAAGEDVLLVAMGNVADEDGRAQGLAKIGDDLEPLVAQEAGGFDGLPDGAMFSGKGMTFTVTRSSDTPLAGGESPPYPAELLLQRADGAERTIVGLWTCGP